MTEINFLQLARLVPPYRPTTLNHTLDSPFGSFCRYSSTPYQHSRTLTLLLLFCLATTSRVDVDVRWIVCNMEESSFWFWRSAIFPRKFGNRIWKRDWILLIFINLIGFKFCRWLQLTPRVVPQGNEMSIPISFGNGEDPDSTRTHGPKVFLP